MADYSSKIGPVDEDGYQVVLITQDDVVIDRQYLRGDIATQWTSQEIGLLAAMEDDGECEHGLSAGLCNGPMHY